MTTGDASRIFVDTNILVYASIAQTEFHALAVRAILKHGLGGRQLWISRQILREYLATVTRPQASISPVDISVAISEVRSFEERFRVAEDTSNVTSRLLDLLNETGTGGKHVHDANIVATMLTYGIGQLLTHNTSDFDRFSDIITILPLKQDS